MWSEEEYWSKARLYVRRAQQAEFEDGLYPFWLSLAMEFLGRQHYQRLALSLMLTQVVWKTSTLPSV